MDACTSKYDLIIHVMAINKYKCLQLLVCGPSFIPQSAFTPGIVLKMI